MRLTRKDEEKRNWTGYIYSYQHGFTPRDYDFHAMFRLGQLEDIEEETGISLVTLFKALKTKIIYVKNAFCPEAGEHWELNGNFIVSLEFVSDNEGIDDFIRNKVVLAFEYQESELDFFYMVVRLQDYGKTWALTKDELL